ncbi:uncharacterized protein LOC143024641 isoform X2 [Oratosquilla oratoria]
MKCPRVQHFLCCIGLRTGVLSVAYIGVIGDILSLFTIMVIIANKREMFEDDDTGLREEMLRRAGTQEVPTLLVSIGLLGLLICGVIKRRPGFFIPWMAMAGFAMIMYTIILVAFPFLWAIIFPDDLIVIWIAMPIAIVLYIFSVHYFLVVISYYKQLKEEIWQEMQVETQVEAQQSKMLVQNNKEDPLDLPPSYSDAMKEVAV